MKLEHLTNRSIATLQSELTSVFRSARKFSIATAFINDEAITMIENALKKKRSPVKGCLLTGLYANFNKKKNLERLLALTRDHPDRLQVHISLDPCFHWKYYYFNTSKQNVLYTGSANFTNGGLQDNRELVIKLSDTIGSSNRSFTALLRSFEKEWEYSRPLSEFPLQHYKEAVRPRGLGNPLHPNVKDFFASKSKEKQPIVDTGKFYAVGIYDDAKPATVKAVHNQKNEWIRNKWDWFTLPYLKDYETCSKQKLLLVFSKEARDKVYCFYSERMDQDSGLSTPDGKYFIAYRTVRYKRLSRSLLEKLRDDHSIDLIGWKDQFHKRLLTTDQTKKIMTLLGF